MGVNYVKLGNGEAIVDLRNSTVTPETMLSGVTAKDSKGNDIVGTIPIVSQATPTAIKSDVINNGIYVTPAVTNTTGYITGGTKTGTGVRVSASDLVSGTLSVTENGVHDVRNYASVNVDVAGGGASILTCNVTITTNGEFDFTYIKVLDGKIVTMNNNLYSDNTKEYITETMADVVKGSVINIWPWGAEILDIVADNMLVELVDPTLVTLSVGQADKCSCTITFA